MDVWLKCPNSHCGKTYLAQVAVKRDSIQCKKCGQTLVVCHAGRETHGDDRAPGTRFVTDHSERPLSHARSLEPATGVDRIGRFLIHGKLGAGAFGTVYHASDPILDRNVALKVPNTHSLESPKALKRFLREAKAAAQLRHPHIVPVYDVGKEADQLFIAGALVDGKSLATIIEEDELSLRQSVRIVADLAGAIGYAHSRGIVHRDVKPANVMIDASGEAHLTDFGLARLAESRDKLTHDGAFLGTPAYMSPEQCLDSGDVSPASDQYSLGVMMYELLCGRTPFAGPPEVHVFNHLNTAPPSPRDIVSNIPRDLEVICLKTLSKRTADRYDDCFMLADDIRRWQEGEPIRARKASLSERAVRWSQRNPKFASLICVSLTAVVAFVVTTTALIHRLGEQTQELDRALAQARRLEGVAQAEARTARASLAKLRRETIARAKAEKSASLATSRQRESTQALQVVKSSAEVVRQELDEASDQLSHTRYLTLIEGAQDAIRAGNLRLAADLLDAAPSEHRSWEWCYLSRFASGLTITALDASGWVIRDFSDAVLRGRADAVNAIAFSPVSRDVLAAAGSDGNVTLWRSGKPPVEFRVSSEPLTRVVFNDAGTMFAAGDNKGNVVVSTTTRTLDPPARRSFSQPVSALAFSLDSTVIAVGTTKGDIEVWNVDLKSRTLEIHSKRASKILSLLFYRTTLNDPDRQEKVPVIVLVSCSEDGYVAVWSGTGERVGLRRVFREGASVAVRGDKQSVYIGHTSGDRGILARISVHIKARLDRVRTVEKHGAALVSKWREFIKNIDVILYEGKKRKSLFLGKQLAVDPKHTMIATNSAAGIELWDLGTRTRVRSIRGNFGMATGLSWAEDGSLLACGSADGHVRIWSVGENAAPFQERVHDFLAMVFLQGDGLAFVARDHNVKIRPVTNDDPTFLQSIDSGPDEIVALCVSPDYARLATVAKSGSLRVWDPHTCQCIWELAAVGAGIQAIAFVDSHRFVTADESGKLSVRDVATGRIVRQTETNHLPRCAVYDRTNKRLFLGCADGTIGVWRHDTNQLKMIPAKHESAVVAVALNRNGDRLASALENNDVLIWNLHDMSVQTTIKLASNHATSLQFTPDGMRLLTTASSNSLRFWDTTNGSLVFEIWDSKIITNAAISHDGRYLVTRNIGCDMRVFDGKMTVSRDP